MGETATIGASFRPSTATHLSILVRMEYKTNAAIVVLLLVINSTLNYCCCTIPSLKKKLCCSHSKSMFHRQAYTIRFYWISILSPTKYSPALNFGCLTLIILTIPLWKTLTLFADAYLISSVQEQMLSSRKPTNSPHSA